MATTRQYLSGTTTMRQLMSKVADALVSTGKWDKIVDNTPTTGTNPTTGHFVIVSPKQTYQYRTAGGNTTDSGAGASPRYTHNTVTGAERIYFKFNPLFNASNQYLGYTIQQCNQMNAGGTDLYGTSGQIQAGGIYDYKYADGSAANTATWGTTNTWYHRVACTKQCISPTNTNYINHDVVLPYTAFGAQEANVRYWLIVGTDDSPTLANSKDKEDWFVLTVQGLDGTTNTIGSNICGIFKSDFLWHNYYGVARSILCPIINFITTTGAGSSYASVNPLVCFGTVFDNTIFQNPSTLLGQFSHRAADISITNVWIDNDRIPITARANLQTSGSLAGDTAILLLQAPTTALNPATTKNADYPYSTTKIIVDLLKDAVLAFVPKASRIKVWAASQTSGQNNGALITNKSFVNLPEDLIFVSAQGVGVFLPNTVNAGDYVLDSGKKYLWVRNAGYSTYQGGYTYSYLLDATGF